MKSSNPVLAGVNADYATFHQPAPPATPYGAPQVQEVTPEQSTETRLTVTDVVVKTSVLFAILLVGAVVGWRLTPDLPWLPWVGAIGGFVLVIAVSAKRVASPPLALLYAVFEGLFVGGISYWYQNFVNQQQGADADNIVAQAIIGTLAAFAALLALFSSKKIRVTPKAQRMFFVALLAYAGIAVVSMLAAIFAGTGGGFGFYGVGPLGILLCMAGVALASWSLVIDFDLVEKSVAMGAPERESWRLGLGLIVSLVWLYLELLRLLAILNRD